MQVLKYKFPRRYFICSKVTLKLPSPIEKELEKVRTIIAYRHYFEEFFEEKTIGLI